MLAKLTTIALLAAAAAARASTSDFLQYESEFGKSHLTVAEQVKAFRCYQEADDIIAQVNELAANDPNPNAATAAHNFLSDDCDRQHYLGRAMEEAGRESPYQEDVHYDGPSAAGRRLQTYTPVDWAAQGYMHPVKNQRQCGSCYAFGANTALEGQLMKRLDIQNTDGWFHLSEQEALECSDAQGNNGCQGGLEYNVWDYMIEGGRSILQETEYPYTSDDQACSRTDDQAALNYGVTGWQRAQRDSIDAMKEAVSRWPVAVGVYASCNAFMFYKEGIITEAECPVTRRQMDHSVVLVGWSEGSSTNTGGSTGTNNDGSGTPTPITTCRNTRWYSQCTVDNGGGSGGDDYNGAYWRVQNSWGPGWGENGFARIAMTGDGSYGVSCINCDVTWPTVDLNQVSLSRP